MNVSLRFVVVFTFLVGLVTLTIFGKHIPSDECKPRPCNCSDAQLMECFLEAQESNLQSWERVQQSFETDPPANFKEARQRYDQNASASQFLLEKMIECPEDNDVLGGISLSGTHVSSCLCNEFCDGIVNSVINHERIHLMDYMLSFDDISSAIGIRMFDQAKGDQIFAAILTSSEVKAHAIQVMELQVYLSSMKDSTGRSCTIEPCGGMSHGRLDNFENRSAHPRTLLARVQTLCGRIIRGS